MATANDLPQANIAQILRVRHGARARFTKEARQSLSHAAQLFVLFLTATANETTQANRRSTISAQDVLRALEELDLEASMGPTLRAFLDAFRSAGKAKRSAAAASRAAVGSARVGVTAVEDEDEGEDEGEDGGDDEGEDEGVDGAEEQAEEGEEGEEEYDSGVVGDDEGVDGAGDEEPGDTLEFVGDARRRERTAEDD